MSVYVDIPQASCVDDADGSFKHIGTFKTRKEAIAFCQEHFGADEEGRVQLVTGGGEPTAEDFLLGDETDEERELCEHLVDADDGCPLGSLDPNKMEDSP